MKRILVLLLCALLAVSAFAGGAGETAETAAAADSGKTVLEVYWWGAAVRNDLTQEAPTGQATGISFLQWQLAAICLMSFRWITHI